MHIPDGMLSTPVVAVTGASSAGFVGYAVAWTRKRLTEHRTVLMAVMAALIFALQMLNFPVAGGTSGHFAGGAAAAIMLGPWPAVITMTTVLVVQSLLFADGGVLALGANVLNMAVIAPFVGFAFWALACRLSSAKSARIAGAFAAGWAATLLAALTAGAEIWLSGNARFALIMGAMGAWHAIIGIGEGIVTAGLVAYVLAVRPDLLDRKSFGEASGTTGVLVSLGLLGIAAAAISFVSSSKPDALEYVTSKHAIGATRPAQQLLQGPLKDYVVPGVTNQTVAGVLAGIVGLIVVGALLWAGVSALKRRGPGSTS